ncbi:39S ribosomal protein L19, mitochondrial [Operophtera brumata]|uniref:Large ribosomal subunit protein bL19m n=1 Tax=Operophtera brumata TaxID=104452 RepID=A0A0L7KV30_OPEBR|nr:39S ribosomal protein L19, mitochondrial [Operophtera brumata]
MALAIRKTSGDLLAATKWFMRRDYRLLSTVPEKAEIVEETTQPEPVKSSRRRPRTNPLLDYRHAFPEFLPDPNPKWRNSLREKLERTDMLKRRNQIDIPEFVGICIERKGCGLRAEFTLRNVVDHQGVEIRYDLYDPTIQNIQVLRLEKRLDDKLFYLRDALPEYSTFPLDMDPEILPEGTPIPVNPVQNKQFL